MAVHGVGKGGKLPPTKMRGQEENALSLGNGPLIVLEPVIHNDVIQILKRVFRKAADLSQLTA